MPAAADLVIRGPVQTMDAARSWSDAVAVRSGRVAALGAAAAAALTGPQTRVIDATGGLVLPGFQDAHVHPPMGGRELLAVDLHDLPGREAYLDRVAGYARAHPGPGWIVGGGWALEHFGPGGPRREDLDAVAPGRPVYLSNRDWHGAWVSSATLGLAGIDGGTPDPADGRIERDPDTGEPSGMLHEGAAYAVNDTVVPQPGREEWADAIMAAQRHLHRLGVTGWQDAWVTPQTQAAYQWLADSGRLTARVVGALWWDRHRGPEQIADLVGRRAATVAGSPFSATSVKIMVDGILENRTGALLQPYCGCARPDGTPETGLSYLERDELRSAVVELDRLGFQVHLHTIGDRAVRDALDAVEAARAANGPADRRHHLAHIQIVQPVDLPRFRRLGVVANCQAYWAQSEPQMDDLTIPFIGTERARLQYPFGDLHAAGTVLALGSDWPVTTADPLQQLEVAARRVDPEHREKPPFLAEQRIPLPVALAAGTAGSAYVNHDAEGGSLAVGRRADLAVLDRDILAPGTFPADATVTHTVARGRLVHGD